MTKTTNIPFGAVVEQSMESASVGKARARKTCEAPGCTLRALYNIPGQRGARFCNEHKEDGMVNANRRKCEHPGCTSTPYYNDPGNPTHPSFLQPHTITLSRDTRPLVSRTLTHNTHTYKTCIPAVWFHRRRHYSRPQASLLPRTQARRHDGCGIQAMRA